MRGGWLAWTALAAGCATTERCPPELILPPDTSFERIGCFDFRPNAPGGPNSLDDFKSAVQPGDFIVTYMHAGRAIAKRQWLFTVLCCGHAMVVLDPHAPDGLLECRFQGAQRVGAEELLLYTNCQVYRLRDRRFLNMDRLHAFGDLACQKVKGYHYGSWIGCNNDMAPTDLSQMGDKYTCSTFLAAAYHYAGVRLSASQQTSKVITPLSLAASVVSPVGGRDR